MVVLLMFGMRKGNGAGASNCARFRKRRGLGHKRLLMRTRDQNPSADDETIMCLFCEAL
jgi:hypothetical protein